MSQFPEEYTKAVSPQVAEEHDQPAIDHLELLRHGLQTGFSLLKYVLILLCLLFLFSNSFWVPEGRVALRVRLGRIESKQSTRRFVKGPGGPYPALPYPFDKIIQFPTTIQHLSLDQSFFLEKRDSGTVNSVRLGDRNRLRPGVDSYLVTADKNIVQGSWIVHYKLPFAPDSPEHATSIVHFVKNVGSLEKARAMMTSLAEAAIVHELSHTDIDRFISGKTNNAAIRITLQRSLDSLQAGISITGVSSKSYSVPLYLSKAFQAVNEAQSEKALLIEKAVKDRVATMNSTAGENWKQLLDIVDALDRLPVGADSTEAYKHLEELMRSGLGGSVGEMLDNARREKTATVEQARTTVDRFNELLPAYRRSPGVLREQLVQDALTEVYSGKRIRAHSVPAGQKIYLSVKE